MIFLLKSYIKRNLFNQKPILFVGGQGGHGHILCGSMWYMYHKYVSNNAL